MKSVKNLVIAGVLLLVSGMAQAVSFTIDLTQSANDFDVTLSGGSHNEQPFFERVLKGTKWTSQRDCTKTIKFSVVPGFGQEQQSSYSVQLTDQKCHKPGWTVSVVGSVTDGFTFIQEGFQND